MNQPETKNHNQPKFYLSDTEDDEGSILSSDNNKIVDNEQIQHQTQSNLSSPSVLDKLHETSKTSSNHNDNDEEDVGDEEDEVEDDDDEIEPKLTYSRIRGDIPVIMKNEFVTCMIIHEKFLILGTQSGKIFRMTPAGEVCSNGISLLHRKAVNQISIDEKADFIASCSDYKIVINELYSETSEPHYSCTFDRPVKALSLDPQYGTSSARRFVIGEADRLLLYEKNLIGRYKATCLQQARGVIRCTSWRRNFIVWSSDLCLKIYDSQERAIITHLDRDKESDYRIKLDLYQCSFSWKDDRTLLVVWGNSVKLCSIIQKNSNQFPHQGSELSLSNMISSAEYHLDNTIVTRGGGTGLRKYYVELIYSFYIENHLIACGAAPFEDRLLILCTNKTLLHPTIDDTTDTTFNDNNNKMLRVKMVEPKNADLFTDISDDILQPNDFLKTVQKSRDVSIHYSPEENIYLILCPKDLIIARPRKEDDSIDWLLTRGKFREAFQRIKSNESKCVRHSFESVGQLYIRHLLKQQTLDSCEEAGKICQELCYQNPKLWEEQMCLFKQFQCLRVLTKYLPGLRKGDSVQTSNGQIVNFLQGNPLEPHLYEMVLDEFLEVDSPGFLNIIRTLPPHFYSTSNMINQTTNKLSSQPDDQNLLEALAELHTFECRYRKALLIFLQVGNAKKVFDLIWKHQLLYVLEDRIVEFLQMDPEETSRLLILNQDTIPSEKVVSRLQKHPKLLCAYLDRLIHRDPGACAPYHDLLFDLYASNEPDKIVPLLRQSNYIQLEKALDICKKKNLTKAVVFILGRMGNTHEALRIIIEKMDDINAAIEFCKEHGDIDLWAELMDISVSKGTLLSKLLREVGTHAADPIGLISRIPKGMEVPDLVPSLVKILQDYRLMVTLEEGCKRVLNNDCYNLFAKLYQTRSRAVVVKDQERYCHSCEMHQASSNGISGCGEFILFQCGHLFHLNCLPFSPNNNDNNNSYYGNRLCTICQTKDKKSSPVIPGGSSSTTAPISIANNQNSHYYHHIGSP